MSLIRKIVSLIVNLTVAYVLTAIFYQYIDRQYASIFYIYSISVMIGIYLLKKKRIFYIKIMLLSLFLLSLFKYAPIVLILLPFVIRYDDLRIYIKSFLRRIKNG